MKSERLQKNFEGNGFHAVNILPLEFERLLQSEKSHPAFSQSAADGSAELVFTNPEDFERAAQAAWLVAQEKEHLFVH